MPRCLQVVRYGLMAGALSLAMAQTPSTVDPNNPNNNATTNGQNSPGTVVTPGTAPADTTNPYNTNPYNDNTRHSSNFGWIGLVGLAGLLGLRRPGRTTTIRDRDRFEDTRNPIR